MDVCYQATIRFDRIKFLQDQTPQPRLLPFWLQNPEELILNFQFQEELTQLKIAIILRRIVFKSVLEVSINTQIQLTFSNLIQLQHIISKVKGDLIRISMRQRKLSVPKDWSSNKQKSIICVKSVSSVRKLVLITWTQTFNFSTTEQQFVVISTMQV